MYPSVHGILIPGQGREYSLLFPALHVHAEVPTNHQLARVDVGLEADGFLDVDVVSFILQNGNLLVWLDRRLRSLGRE